MYSKVIANQRWEGHLFGTPGTYTQTENKSIACTNRRVMHHTHLHADNSVDEKQHRY